MSLPPYINNDIGATNVGLPVFQGPYMQENAGLAVFGLQADHDKLQGICDRYLNNVSDEYEYIPVLDYVLLIYADMTIYSLNQEEINIGKMRETDLAFWIPVLVRKKDNPFSIPHLAFFLPYLFVDNPYAVATGREVYGFRKIFSSFDFSGDITQPEFTSHTLAFKEFGADKQAANEWVLKMQQAGASNTKADKWGKSDASQAFNAISKLLLGENHAHVHAFKDADKGILGDLSHDILNLLFRALETNVSIPLAFLKQFPDITSTEFACYQKAVEAPAVLNTFHGAGLFDTEYELHVNDLASFPIVDDLGLNANAGVINPLFSFWTQIDFTMDFGREV